MAPQPEAAANASCQGNPIDTGFFSVIFFSKKKSFITKVAIGRGRLRKAVLKMSQIGSKTKSLRSIPNIPEANYFGQAKNNS